jgi:hypothetical protein
MLGDGEVLGNIEMIHGIFVILVIVMKTTNRLIVARELIL